MPGGRNAAALGKPEDDALAGRGEYGEGRPRLRWEI